MAKETINGDSDIVTFLTTKTYISVFSVNSVALKNSGYRDFGLRHSDTDFLITQCTVR